MEKDHTLPALNQSQVIIMSIAAGVAVANIYYNQPILKNIAASFHAADSKVGIISMLAQVGYGLGLFCLAPLGDKLSRKKLILLLMLLLTISLVAMVLAPSFSMVAGLSLLLGILSVSPQVIIPLAAQINKATRGKTVGTILSGLLIGILSARVLSGWIADHYGWKMVFGLSAVLCAVILILLYFVLPDVKGEFKGNYFSLLQSTLKQIVRFAELREAAIMGGLLFGVFCSFWTTLTFHLSGEPFHYSAEKIGMFGLVAIAGALMAPIVGSLTDKGKTRLALLISTLLTLLSVILIKIFPTSIPIFILAIILLDIGVQGAQVANASRIYALDQNSGSRINTVYMTSYFLGGAVGTAAGLLCWKWGGWQMVTNQMLIWSVLALLTLLIGGKIIKKK